MIVPYIDKNKVLNRSVMYECGNITCHKCDTSLYIMKRVYDENGKLMDTNHYGIFCVVCNTGFRFTPDPDLIFDVGKERRSKLITHYFKNASELEKNQLLAKLLGNKNE